MKLKILGIAVLITLCYYINVFAGIPDVYTSVRTWPTKPNGQEAYPATSVTQVDILIFEKNGINTNYVQYQNAASPYRWGTIELLCVYWYNNNPEISFWDWSRSKGNKVHLAENPDVHYICIKDHISSDNSKPGTPGGYEYWMVDTSITSSDTWSSSTTKKYYNNKIESGQDSSYSKTYYRVSPITDELVVVGHHSDQSSPPNGDFLKPEVYQGVNYLRLRTQNINKYHGTEVKNGRIQEKNENIIRFWDWSLQQWVVIYSRVYYTDIYQGVGMNRATGTAFYPWMETNPIHMPSGDKVLMRKGSRFGFDNARILLPDYGINYLVEPGTVNSTFYANSNNWIVNKLEPNYLWVVEWKGEEQ